MEKYPVLDSVKEYETPWYSGGYDVVEQPDSSEKRYYWADLPNAVTVVPILDSGDLVLIDEYRPVTQHEYRACPTGVVEDGESYEEAAFRELREETGYRAESTHLLQEIDVAAGILRHQRGVVVATGLEQGSPSRDDNEFLTVATQDPDEALERVRTEPTNGATLEALMLAKADGFF